MVTRLAQEVAKWPVASLHQLKSQLQEIQSQLQNLDARIHLNPALCGPQEQGLRSEYNRIRGQITTYWAQRSRLNWVRDGDET